MRKIFITLFCFLSVVAKAQSFIHPETDSTVVTEYHDGLLWAFREIDGLVVGMSNSIYKDDYGKNYQIQIYIYNGGDHSVVFDPALITSKIKTRKGRINKLEVYTYDAYIKKIKQQQAIIMALLGLSAGISAGMAGYQTTYTTTYGPGYIPYTQVHTTYNYAAASAANIAATTQIMTLGKLMENDTRTYSQGYWKITTIYPREAMTGYINIDYSKGETMAVNIPFGEKNFPFLWIVSKKK